MANEWAKVELYGANNDGNPVRYTIANGTSVSKGQLLSIATPRTAVAVTVRDNPIAGVAAEEHIANVGITSIAVWTDGIFDATASKAIHAGAKVIGTTANMVTASEALMSDAASNAIVLGYALEDIGDAAVGAVRLRI